MTIPRTWMAASAAFVLTASTALADDPPPRPSAENWSSLRFPVDPMTPGAPYELPDGGGLQAALVEAVLTEAGIDLLRVDLTWPDRARHAIRRGDTDLDFPMNVMTADIGDRHVSTDPLIQVDDIWIARPGTALPPADGGRGLVVAVPAWDASVPRGPYRALEVQTAQDLVAAVARGEADAAYADALAARYWARQLSVDIQLGPTIRTRDVTLRMTDRRMELYPRVQEAIARLRADGRFDTLVGTFID